MSNDEKKSQPKNVSTLDETEIVSERQFGRRSTLGVIGGGLLGALALAGSPGTAHAVTDSDSGNCADPAGRGRGRRSRGVTDSDGGPCADPGGFGRGRGGVTDNDSGSCSDPASQGRGPRQRGVTDSDNGACADPSGWGRGR